jgi:hypothetical protein
MQEGQIPLAFKVVAEKTCVSGRGESSRPSGVLYFAPSPVRELVYLDVSTEEQANCRISMRGSLERICVMPLLCYT